MSGGARAVADVTTGIVLAEIDIEAPVDDVFDALTEPAQLVQWWGGDLYRTFDWQIDLRPGGAWSVQAESPNGKSSVHGTYLVVERPLRLVYTWCASWFGFSETTIHITLRPIHQGTHVDVRHEGFAGQPAQCREHGEGWQRVLGWVDAWLARVRRG